MGDDNRDIGVVARSCNINKPNNVIAPKLGLNASHVWNYFDRPLCPHMNSFTGLSEIVSLDFPIARQERSYDQTPLTQSRTRKNHSIMLTYESSQQELTNDKWAWRKYSQKYIKGSPFPRNYYKCSTSKHCEAKKQIEKSSKDENIFLLPKGINISPKESIFNASSSSSKRVKHSTDVASPIIGTKPPLEIGSKNKMVVAVVHNIGDGEEKVYMNEDIIMGIDQL
ncbi:hypothetical protein EJD97_017592 [Solanum chilense]|uniref:WRKY domain-containing protein n=1 Tax=Solanum chilense TaxID=4083 RepID=A0A6N2CDV3_SOLCI|nr:hypothetical protein EJD97_017592 [Solanum chilense]